MCGFVHLWCFNQVFIFLFSILDQHQKMSRPPILIKDLPPDQKHWKIVIHVIDLWLVKERNGQQHVEVIIQDAEVYISYML